MTKHETGTWTFRMEDKLPFSLTIMAGDECIFHEYAISHSTEQKTRQDCLDAVGFSGSQRDEAVAEVAKQVARFRLAAAAPDLLAACEAALKDSTESIPGKVYYGPGHELKPETIAALRAAIAKAEPVPA